MPKKIQTVLLTITVKQLQKLLKTLYVACDRLGVEWTKDKELKELVTQLQAEFYTKTGRWWVS